MTPRKERQTVKGTVGDLVEYPYVLCGSDFSRKDIGYCVCQHIRSRSDVFLHDPGTTTNMGLICCAECKEVGTEEPLPKGWFLKNFRVACKHCVLEMGLIDPVVN